MHRRRRPTRNSRSPLDTLMAIGPFKEVIPTDSLKTVAEVVPKLEIRDIRLLNLSCGLTAPPPPAGAIRIDLSHEVSVDLIENSALGVQVHYSLNASPEAADSAPFLKMTVIFQLLYDGENLSAISAEKRQMFGDINGVHNAWPYFRELVQSVSSRMGLPPLTVPLLKLGPTRAPDKIASRRTTKPPS